MKSHTIFKYLSDDVDSHPFDIIYHAARNKNKNKILPLLSSVSIDVQKGPYAPIYLLAAALDFDSVDFLKENFHASNVWIAAGYAYAGYEVEKILELVGSMDEYQCMLQSMAHSYALNGNKSEVDKILRLPNVSVKDIYIYCISGYATGGYVSEVEAILKLTHPQEIHNRLLIEIMFGYAIAGNKSEVTKILESSKTKDLRHSYLREIVTGYTLGGFDNETLDFILLCPETLEERLLILKAVIGAYAFIGNTVKVAEILESVASSQHMDFMEIMACSYARGGYIKEAINILNLVKLQTSRNHFMDRIAWFTAFSLHYSAAHNILNLVNESFEEKIISDGLFLGYKERGLTEAAANQFIAFAKKNRNLQSKNNCNNSIEINHYQQMMAKNTNIDLHDSGFTFVRTYKWHQFGLAVRDGGDANLKLIKRYINLGYHSLRGSLEFASALTIAVKYGHIQISLALLSHPWAQSSLKSHYNRSNLLSSSDNNVRILLIYLYEDELNENSI